MNKKDQMVNKPAIRSEASLVRKNIQQTKMKLFYKFVVSMQWAALDKSLTLNKNDERRAEKEQFHMG